MATISRYPAWARDAAGYVFTNRAHVFVMPALLTFFWNLDLRLPLPWTYYLMITLSTASGYIINMYTDRDEDALNYTAQYRFFGVRPKVTKTVAALCWLGAFLLSLQAGVVFVLSGGVILAVAALYGYRFRFGGGQFRIKDVPVLKNLYAGVLWSAALIGSPYLFVGQRPGWPAVLLIFISLGANFFVELMWDVRDVAGDRASGVRTIPVLFGENAAFWILRTSHVFTCAAIGLGLWLGWLHPEKAAITIILYFPIGLLFLERYRRLSDKVWASNGFLLIAAGIILVAMIPPLAGFGSVS